MQLMIYVKVNESELKSMPPGNNVANVLKLRIFSYSCTTKATRSIPDNLPLHLRVRHLFWRLIKGYHDDTMQGRELG